ncbi:hypothetical protein Y1Q_0016549 [Alligator mississippiensis]|uniref:ribonuclease H n=1 Tax=Alligator mississippiensis TaxID=8496 RepID=A0A151N3M7_ALLMI|nr:hypothetical protein Y1Q_0016549 [Alligator mississippiensis]
MCKRPCGPCRPQVRLCPLAAPLILSFPIWCNSQTDLGTNDLDWKISWYYGWGISKPGRPDKVRLVVDYREANKRCQPLVQPNTSTLPQCLSEMAQYQKGKWYRATIDLKNIFYAIPILDTEGVLNMSVEGMMYKWTVCPQGYRNAPALATAAMNHTLKTFSISHALLLEEELKIWNYVDDITIMGRNQQQVTEITNRLVNHLHSKGWTVNLKKSQATETIQFLGTSFIGATRSGATHKALDISPLGGPLPTEKKELQWLLGYLNWYRHHITPDHLPILAKLERQTHNKFQKSAPWTEKEKKDLRRLLIAIKTTPLHAINLANSITVTLEFTASHVWATTHNPCGEIIYTSHKTLQAAQFRYGTVGKILLVGQLIELVSCGHGTLRAPAATVLPLLRAEKVDPQFHGEPATWSELVINHHYHWCCWKSENTPPTPDTQESPTPTLYGATDPAWMASDGTSRNGGGYRFYCKACRDAQMFPGYPSAQRNELLGFKAVIQHCPQHHDGTLPTPVTAIDSLYIYQIITGTATAAENLEDWQEIWNMLSDFTTLPLVKHTRSPKTDTDPVHETIDKLLEDPLRNDVVLAIKQPETKPEADPFLAWLHENWGHPGPRASHACWRSAMTDPMPYGIRADWNEWPKPPRRSGK